MTVQARFHSGGRSRIMPPAPRAGVRQKPWSLGRGFFSEDRDPGREEKAPPKRGGQSHRDRPGKARGATFCMFLLAVDRVGRISGAGLAVDIHNEKAPSTTYLPSDDWACGALGVQLLLWRFGIWSRNQVHACMIWRSRSGNFGLQRNNSRALLESLTSTGGSPGRRPHISVGTDRPVTFSLACTTSATECGQSQKPFQESLAG
jgi:hypothetical protein